MRLWSLTLVVFLIGCHSAQTETPATQRLPTPNTRIALQAIELQYGIYLARLDIRITVTPDGLLRSVRTENKGYGANDIDPKYERIEIREGELSQQQMAELSRLFTNWGSLSLFPYGGVPDGGNVSIRYGNKIASGGSAVPKQVQDVRGRLEEFAASMPIVNQ